MAIKHNAVYLLVLLACLCAPTRGQCAGAKNVLVIINDNSPASVEIGEYYAARRKIPAGNVCRIKCPDTDQVDIKVYQDQIEQPVRDFLSKNGRKKYIDYLVLTKGIPIRSGGGRSVDGLLMCMDEGLGFDFDKMPRGIHNPYYGRTVHFSHADRGLYLATRLDGYTVADAKALVDRSLAAKPLKGTFLIDMASNRNDGSYRLMNLAMAATKDMLEEKGYTVELDTTKEFIGDRKDLMGYFSWGSNDSAFDLTKYKSNRYAPGAIAETVVSTSARTFSHAKNGQSLIADLIEAGVTGVKGYVSEPYLDAIAEPQVMFGQYVSGYNLAESFYSASRFILWKDIVIGDPLCAPYAGAKH